MSYKCMNTFVDDLFSFVIKMPIMHRLACLRDDMIFFVFLYQRWKYRTDYSRVNEYGQCAQPTEEMISAAQLSNAGEADTAGSTMLPKSRSVPSASNGNTNNGVRQRRGAREKKH